MNVIKKIEKEYNSFTNTQKKIADYLVSNPSKICYISLDKLSQEIGCAEVTVLNFSKKIGYTNFLNLKEAFRRFNKEKINQLSGSSIKDIEFSSSDTNKFLKDIIDIQEKQIRDFYTEIDFLEIEQSSNKILNSNNIYIIGHDASKNIGSLLYTRLETLNLSPVLVDLEDMYSTEFKLEQVRDNDVVFFISFPNYYYASKSIAELVSEKTNNFILLTDSKDSPVFPYAGNILYCETFSTIFNNSWLTPLACINIITNLIALKRNKK